MHNNKNQETCQSIPITAEDYLRNKDIKDQATTDNTMNWLTTSNNYTNIINTKIMKQTKVTKMPPREQQIVQLPMTHRPP